MLANAIWYPSQLRFLATSQALPFRILSQIVLLAKSLLSEDAASWAKQALSNSFLYKCFELPVYLYFGIFSRYLVISPQAIKVNPGCFKCSSGINLSPFNKNSLMILFNLN